MSLQVAGAALGLALLPVWAFAAAPGALPVSKHTLTDRNPILTIEAHYPQTGDVKIDADLRDTVNRIAASFRKEAKASHDDPKEAPYTLDVDYTIARNDGQVFAVIFNDEWDFHGAHPNLEIVTADYLRAGSWRVYLPELFDGDRALARISKLATQDLEKRLLVPDGYSDKDWIDRGADAHWDNFQAFVLGKDALEIEFPPYQVAAYADGPQQAHVPLAKLADLMRQDPRRPVASFDCARAKTDDEHAICSDVALARLDRAVAESWSSQMRNETDAARKAALKDGQVRWLNLRENACREAGTDLRQAAGSNPATGRVACLTKVYQARLDALSP